MDVTKENLEMVLKDLNKDVKGTLRKHEIKGRPQACCGCPIAMYLRKVFDATSYDVLVSAHEINLGPPHKPGDKFSDRTWFSVYISEEIMQTYGPVRTPIEGYENIVSFINAFDASDYDLRSELREFRYA
jgi:hypothetical protein